MPEKKDLTDRQFIWALFAAWAIIPIGILFLIIIPMALQ